MGAAINAAAVVGFFAGGFLRKQRVVIGGGLRDRLLAGGKILFKKSKNDILCWIRFWPFVLKNSINFFFKIL